jgi:hypothetical protein
MGKIVMMVFAFCIGAVALNAAQKYWMSAMMERVDEASSSRKDWLPPSNPMPAFDPSQFRSFNPQMGVIPATRP